MRLFKILLSTLATLFVLGALAVFCLPIFLSTEGGRKQLETYLSYSLQARVSVEKLSLCWLSNQTIEKLQIASPDYNIYIDSIKINESLWRFIGNGLCFEKAEINTPKLQIVHIQETKADSSSSSFLFLIKHIKLSSGFFSFQTKDKETLTLSDLFIDLNLKRILPLINFKISGLTSFEQEKGKIDLLGEIDASWNFTTDISIVDLPVKGVDALLGYLGITPGSLLSESFGNSMNIQLKANSKTGDIESRIISRYFNLNLNTKNTTSPPLVFEWTVNPSFLALFNISIDKPFQFASSVTALDLPSLFDWQSASVQMKTTLSNLDFSPFAIKRFESFLESKNIGHQLSISSNIEFASSYLSGHLNINSTIFDVFKDLKLTLKAFSNSLLLKEPLTNTTRAVSLFSVQIPTPLSNEIKGELALSDSSNTTLLGNQFSAQFSSQFSFFKKNLVLKNIQCKANSELMKSSIQASFNSKSKTLELVRDGYIDYKLTPAVFASLSDTFKLKKDTAISLLLEKTSSLEKIDLHLFSEDCEILSNTTSFDLHNIDSQIQFKPLQETVSAKVHMSVMSQGFLQAFLESNMKTGQTSLKLQGKSLPSIPVKTFAPEFYELLGSVFDGSAILKKEAQGNYKIDFDLLSLDLKAKGGTEFSQNGVLVGIYSPIKIDLRLTEQAYGNLSKLDRFKLQKPANLSCSISKFRQDPAKGFLGIELKAALSLKDFVASNGEMSAEIKEAIIQLEKKSSEPAKGTLLIPIFSEGDKSEIVGSFNLSKLDTNLPLLLALSKSQLMVDFLAAKVPSTLIDAIIQPFSQITFSNFAGKTLNAEVSINLEDQSKKFLVNATSSTGKLYLNGSIAQNRLILNAPIECSLIVTPGITMQLYDAFGITIAKSSIPIQLSVSNRGFGMPLQPNALFQTEASPIILDLGRLTAVNKGTVDGVNALFKIKGQSTIQLWFAPFYMHLASGKLVIERTEILMDNRMHICVWGSIDLVKKWVKLTVGLTAESLKQTLGISGVPATYVLQVPLEGPFGNVELKKGAVASKIALLIGSQAAPSNTIFGGVVKTVNSIMNDQSKVPAAKRPYPWEKQ